MSSLLPPSPSWSRHRAATFGDGTGADNDLQVYYKNDGTGETSWATPEEFATEEECLRKEAAGGEWERAEDFREEVRNLTPSLGGIDPVPALGRLCDLAQTRGTAEEWREIIGGQDGTFPVPAVLCEILVGGHGREGGGGYSPAFSYAARNLVLFSKLHPGIWSAPPDPSLLLRAAVNGLEGALEGGREEEAVVCCMLVQEMVENFANNFGDVE